MFDDQTGWGASGVVSTGDVVKDAVKKEQMIKDIVAFQDDLRVLLERVKAVERDSDKLSSGNATLQMYIDNLTLQMAKRR
ncbi:hypothetical protein DFH94DRAFT_756277 [Russula ochroleuca]|jgi:hypothetical protein|uniref:Uncharacterized protein n=1 Tax=Russula ochroleuca TaxID=152965 RepID=A0A9P5MS32_9AGAM|nr:hypothetical protein DFH94DRAFT_756277 [Russula ochroleuca]